MRFLFVKPRLAWPRSKGHDVHCYHLMKALAQSGHQLGLATVVQPDPEAVAGLPLELCRALGDFDQDQRPSPLTGLAERFRSYWGIPPGGSQPSLTSPRNSEPIPSWSSGSTSCPILAMSGGDSASGTRQTSGSGTIFRRCGSVTARPGAISARRP